MLNALTDGLKTILLAGVGAVAVTAEKSKEVIDELVKKGEITVEQGKVLNEELGHKIKAKCKEAADAVSAACSETDSKVEEVMKDLEDMTEEELAAIKAKLEDLNTAKREEPPAEAEDEKPAETDE